MRTGACAVQQGLTSEAAAVLKQAMGLARRRGHAQVTPVHVAATLLGCGGLFQRACLRSHPRLRGSDPLLHFRALELCFNVALNRLPTVPSPHAPAFSNALVAALKRAQAHHRRGAAAASPAAPPLPPKTELALLAISILDDPSVSRVMREASFSSSSVKSRLEHDASPSPPLPPPLSFPSQSQTDLALLINALLRRTNAALVGDSVSYASLLVSDLMSKVERRAPDLPDELRSACWLNLDPDIALTRKKIASLRGAPAIVYAGDLRRIIEEDDGVVAQVGRLLSEFRGEVSLVAIADLQTYLKWKLKQPRLKLQWALQALPVPCGGPALSLHVSSEEDSYRRGIIVEDTRWRRELLRRLAENVPWQPTETVAAVAAAVPWVVLGGSDAVGKRRLCAAVCDFFCGSSPDRLVRIDAEKGGPGAERLVEAALRRDPSSVFLVHGADAAEVSLLRALAEIYKPSARTVFVVCKPELSQRADQARVVSLRLLAETTKPPKRKLPSPREKSESWATTNPRRAGAALSLDLNLSPGDDEEEDQDQEEEEEEEDDGAAPSDLTQENGSGGGDGVIVVDGSSERRRRMTEHFRGKLRGAFAESAQPGCSFAVDQDAVEELSAAAGSFLETLFDDWLRDVFQASLRPLAKPGARLRLCAIPPPAAPAPAFYGSALPTRILSQRCEQAESE
ncbi:protein SMAX1-LIKE 5-like [Wolffia australiana]